MMIKRNKLLALFLILPFLLANCNPNRVETVQDSDSWQLGPFQKNDKVNPVLEPRNESTFLCPVRNDTVFWESKDVFNPAAVVKEDTLFLIYRAEDKIGKYSGTSRLGLAYSLNGVTFIRLPEPILFPDNDEFKKYEWEGGIEDPRIVHTEEGFAMTYTAYDGKVARLCIAHSNDLRSWTKLGPIFLDYNDSLWSKSGSIVSKLVGNKLIATKINGKYWMYWGDTDLFLASSEDLMTWEPELDEYSNLLKVLSPRPGMFDSRLVEPGPPAIITEQGVLLLYNGMNLEVGGDTNLPAGNYAAGQALFDSNDPARLLKRSDRYFLNPDKEYEITGQIGNVCFIEGLARYKNQWFLYYGTADSKIALAISSN